MARFEIERIPVLQDNYVWLVHEPDANVTAAVDPSVAEPVLAAAKRRGWRITHILNTHHHPDHTGGNLEIKDATGATIVGPSHDRDRSARGFAHKVDKIVRKHRDLADIKHGNLT